MDQTLPTGLARVGVSRPRPSYKGLAQSIEDSRNMWKSIALGFAGLFLASLLALGFALHGNHALRENVTTITPGVSK